MSLSLAHTASSAENIAPNSQEPRQEMPPITSYDEKTVSLHRGQKGFGFVLRGAKSTSPVFKQLPHELAIQQQPISLQYLDEIESGGIAEAAGLRRGDFLINVNGVDVRSVAHEFVVQLIRQSGDRVTMTVATPIYLDSENGSTTNNSKIADKKSISASSFSSGKVNNNNKDYSATIPRGFFASGESKDRSRTRPPPAPPKRDPSTTLSVGRARARSLCVRGEEGRSNGNGDNGHSGSSGAVSSQDNVVSSKVGRLDQVDWSAVNGNISDLYGSKYDLSTIGYHTIRGVHGSINLLASNKISHVHNYGGNYNGVKIASIRSRNFRQNYISNIEIEEHYLPTVYENHYNHYSVPDHGQYKTVKAGDEFYGNETVKGRTLQELKKSRKLKKMKEFRSTPDISNSLYKDLVIAYKYQVCQCRISIFAKKHSKADENTLNNRIAFPSNLDCF